jgi:hypothetical protein
MLRTATDSVLDLRQREALFDAKYSLAIYERVMTLEESSLNLQPGEIPAENQLPPEVARIHQIDLPPLPPTSSGRPVNFLTKTHGIEGGWSVRSEYVLINGSELLACFDVRSERSELLQLQQGLSVDTGLFN